MKALKFTLLAITMIATFSSCTGEDLNEDDVLITDEVEKVLDTGGKIQD